MPSAPIIIGTIGLIGYGFYALFGGGKKGGGGEVSKAACDAGFAKGKADALKGAPENLNASDDYEGSAADKAAFENCYVDGYKKNKKGGKGGDDVDPYAAFCMDSEAEADGWTVLMIQQVLNKIGYSPGGIDGICGPKTKGAIGAFQKAKALPVTYYVNRITGGALRDSLDTIKLNTDGAEDPAAFAAGCNAGSKDANASIAASEAVQVAYDEGGSAEYKLGYRECFAKVLSDRGFEIDENGNVYTSVSDDLGWTNSDEVHVIGDTL